MVLREPKPSAFDGQMTGRESHDSPVIYLAAEVPGEIPTNSSGTIAHGGGQ